MSQNGNGQTKHELPRWKEHLSSYRDLRELRFSTKRGNHKALDLLDSTELREMPYGLTDDGIIVPAEGLPYFNTAGKFTERKLHSR
jgi:hypothetical protein